MLSYLGTIEAIKRTSLGLNFGISDINFPHRTINNFKESLARIIAKKPDGANEAVFLCQPANRGEAIEQSKKDFWGQRHRITKTDKEVDYPCRNAFIIADKKRQASKDVQQTIFIEAENIIYGEVFGVQGYTNFFSIHKGLASFYGANGQRNEFYVASNTFSGKITGGIDGAENQLFLSRLSTDNIIYKSFNNTLTETPFVDVIVTETAGKETGLFKAINLHLVRGRERKKEEFYCGERLENAINIQSLGGTLEQPDKLVDCLSATLSASTHYRLDKNWGEAHLTIDSSRHGTIWLTPPTQTSSSQALQFDFNPLASKISYCITNELHIEKELLNQKEGIDFRSFKLVLENYWNVEKNFSNYHFYDDQKSLVQPIINEKIIEEFQNAQISSTYPSECFILKNYQYRQEVEDADKSNEEIVTSYFTRVESAAADVKVVGAITRKRNLEDTDFFLSEKESLLVIGNSESNHFSLLQKETEQNYFYGDEAADYYLLKASLKPLAERPGYYVNQYGEENSGNDWMKSDQKQFRTLINNRANDSHIDTLRIEFEDAKESITWDIYGDSKRNLYLSFPRTFTVDNATLTHHYLIALENYFESKANQHLQIDEVLFNEELRSWIVFHSGNSSNPLTLVPYYPAERGNVFTVSADSKAANFRGYVHVIEGGSDALRVLRYRDDLLL